MLHGTCHVMMNVSRFLAMANQIPLLPLRLRERVTTALDKGYTGGANVTCIAKVVNGASRNCRLPKIVWEGAVRARRQAPLGLASEVQS